MATFAALSVTPPRVDCFIPVSMEWLADVQDADQQLLDIMNDARLVLEASAWVSGTGSSQTPQGLTTALDLTTASRVSTTTAGTFGLVDVFKASTALPARYKAGSAWVAAKDTWDALRQSPWSTSPVDRLPWHEADDLVTPPKLVGVPAYQASGMLTTQTTGADIAVLGNFAKGAVVVDRIGTGIALYQPNVLIGVNRRPIESVAIYAMWRSTFAVVVPQAFQMIRCS